MDGVTDGGTVSTEKPRIAGKAEPFATVDVHDGTTLLGVVSANGEGSWSLQLSLPLFDGVHDLSAEQVGGYGARGLASYFAITVHALDAAPLDHEDDSASTLATAAFPGHTDSNVPYFPPNLFTLHSGASKEAHAMTEPLAYGRHSSPHALEGKACDIVAFHGDHLVLNVSAMSDRQGGAHLPAVGGFDLGGHHNALKISIADVLNLGAHDFFIDDGKQQLIVHGKEGDAVDLTHAHVAGLADGEWQHHGTVQVGGVMYNVVEHSATNTELLVEHAVRIDMH